MSAQRHTTNEDLMLRRIRADFLEMPGLSLTCQQARRLWGLDERACHELLEVLVNARFLYQPKQGTYMRIAVGQSGGRPPRMAKAELVPPRRVREPRNIVEQGSTEYQRQATDTADDLERASRTSVPVLITAERHDQRETCARLIHTRRNQRGPFVTMAVDAGRPHAAGSPRPDAPPAKNVSVVLRQHLSQARSGTLFIDDIANLTPSAQAHLHGLLEELRLTGGGGDHGARVITGASRHLDAERASGRFSEALFYRLNVVHLDWLREQR